MSLSRREVLELFALLGLGSACSPRGVADVEVPEPERTEATQEPSPFTHGVASGDPLADRVILWTRARAMDPELVFSVRWEVAEDEAMEHIVSEGTAESSPDRDYTVKVDATGLQPGREYYYVFEALGHRSPVGRTKTLPTGAVERARIAFTSCANYPQGYFNVYAALARRDDLDLILHLGDYIYEYGNGEYGDGTDLDRVPEPVGETLTLQDYRLRYATYRSDPDLQEVHRRHAFVAVWDDHESANNSWVYGAQNHDPSTEGEWSSRKAAAMSAYFEWLPIREQPDAPERIYRHFPIGDLADLIMLDTRLEGRDEQLSAEQADALAAPERTLLGKAQERWLEDRLLESAQRGAAWRLLGQQVMMGQLRDEHGRPRNTDMWDGYAPARARLFNHLATHRISDVAVLTGDIHSSWAVELAPDPFSRDAVFRRPLAVELVTPAVSSPPPVPAEEAEALEQAALKTHPHLRWVELRHRGYVLLDLDRHRLRASWHFVDTVLERTSEARLARTYEVPRGRAELKRVES